MLWIVLIVLAILIVIGISLFNRITVLENHIKNAWAQVDVQLKRRNDLIPNLLETVKGYAAHEREVFTKVTEARQQSMQASSVQEQAAAENQMNTALGRLFAVAEAYPELKANENFGLLQSELSETEDKIAYARQFYNDAVLRFNNAIQTIPGNLIAGPMGKTTYEPLETPEGERAVPKVSFGA